MKIVICLLLLCNLVSSAQEQGADTTKQSQVKKWEDYIDSTVVVREVNNQVKMLLLNVYLNKRVTAKGLGALGSYLVKKTESENRKLYLYYYLPGCNDVIGGCWSSFIFDYGAVDHELGFKPGIVRDTLIYNPWKRLDPPGLESVSGVWLRDEPGLAERLAIGLSGGKPVLLVDQPGKKPQRFDLQAFAEGKWIRRDDSKIRYEIVDGGCLAIKPYPTDPVRAACRPFKDCIK